MTQHYLVKFDRDWADEFSPAGLLIVTESEKELYEKWLEKPRSWYFGTNEGFEDEDLKDGFTFTAITSDQKAVLENE
jgi:hypothetical protein